MPFNKLKLAEMTADSEEYLDIDSIAERLEVVNRTIERLIEVFAKKLKKSKRRSGHKILYLWSDILQCAKIHMKIEREGTPSVAITRPYMEQRVKELEAEIERLKKEPSSGSAQSVVSPLE